MAGHDTTDRSDVGHNNAGPAMAPVASSNDPHATDPPLLRSHSAFVQLETAQYTYPSVRVFFKRHEQADQLPSDPAPLPLLVFLHGLGGSVAQFHALLTRLTDCASCLAVDLPGCGRSAFMPQDWAAYYFDSLVELLRAAVASHREPEQGVVLIGHSLGSSFAAALARRLADDAVPVSGLVAICPAAELPPRKIVSLFKALLCIPTPVFDLWRAWDSRGGVESPSVRRFVGKDADDETRLLQARFNSQSKTAVWRRVAWGSLPGGDAGDPRAGMPGLDVWAKLDIPVCLISGECDNVTPPTEAKKIASALHTVVSQTNAGDTASDDFRPLKAPSDDTTWATPSGPVGKVDIPPLHRHPPKAVEAHVVPAPATHALLYMPTTIGVVSGLISNFLTRHVSGRLDRGWQLRFLSREGKWDVKNLEKWSKVEPVSAPIAGIFRAMKTLRQVDGVHSPGRFVVKWAPVVGDVIDISHDSPVYDPRDLEAGGVHYHKFPTVSKIPPTADEIEGFEALVDKIRARKKRPSEGAGDGPSGGQAAIGVHCHYGFNRTGYFIVCYLVDRCGYSLPSAIQTFAEARPAGIRHSHFLDALSLRYANVADEDG